MLRTSSKSKILDSASNSSGDSSDTSSNSLYTTEDVSETTGFISARPNANNNNSIPKWKLFCKNITIEPMLFLQLFAMDALNINISSFYLETICERIDWNSTLKVDCQNLSSYPNEEIYVETIAAPYLSYRFNIELCIPILISFLVGPWVDIYGSKIPILLPLVGYTISTLLFLGFTFIEKLTPDILLLASLPQSITGGYCTFIFVGFRFIASITREENRSFRIAMAEAVWLFGSPMGLITGAQIVKYWRYEGLFIFGAVVNTVAFFYGLLFVKFDKHRANNELDINLPKSTFRDALKWRNIFGPFICLFKRRDGYQRMWILLLLGAFCLKIYTSTALWGIYFLYTRNILHWSTTMFSTYFAYSGIALMIGSTLTSTVGMNYLKISDSTIGIFSAIAWTIGFVVFSMATESWIMYLGCSIQMFAGTTTIIIRSMTSKLVSSDEIGRIFSILASFGELSVTALSITLTNFIYVATIETLPQTVSIINAGLSSLIVIIFVIFKAFYKTSRSLAEEIN